MEQKPNGDSALPAEINDVNQMSLLDLVDLLEKGEVNPDVLSKDTQVGCVSVLLERGFSYLEIAKIIHKNERTVYRYLKEVRQENWVMSGPDFQHATIQDAIKCLDRQSARLLKFSHAPLMPLSERVRSIFAACQIKKYKIDFLTKLGYLSEDCAGYSNPFEAGDVIHTPPPSAAVDTFDLLKAELQNKK